MFPQKNRLGTWEFSEVMNKGKGYSDSVLFIKIMKNSVGHTRIGVGVSKGLATKPAKRNYYKRILRHILKDVLSEKDIPYDIIAIAREGAQDKKIRELKENAKNILQNTPIFSK